LPPTSSDPPEPFTNQLRLAVAAYLAGFKGSSREHTEPDLRCYLSGCTERGLDPLAVKRPHLELCIRWMQDPPVQALHGVPEVLRRGRSCRTCVLGGIIGHSPAGHVRRPAVPAGSPTLGFTHLQSEALPAAARQSPDPCDFALVAMLGLLGSRTFEATGDLGEEPGHRVLGVCDKGSKAALVPLPPAAGRATERATGSRTRGAVLLNSRGTRMERHAATRRPRHLATTAGIQITRARPHMLRHAYVTTMCRRGRPAGDPRGLAVVGDHQPPPIALAAPL
jgi:integrase/recombinase XerD